MAKKKKPQLTLRMIKFDEVLGKYTVILNKGETLILLFSKTKASALIEAKKVMSADDGLTLP